MPYHWLLPIARAHSSIWWIQKFLYTNPWNFKHCWTYCFVGLSYMGTDRPLPLGSKIVQAMVFLHSWTPSKHFIFGIYMWGPMYDMCQPLCKTSFYFLHLYVRHCKWLSGTKLSTSVSNLNIWSFIMIKTFWFFNAWVSSGYGSSREPGFLDEKWGLSEIHKN